MAYILSLHFFILVAVFGSVCFADEADVLSPPPPPGDYCLSVLLTPVHTLQVEADSPEAKYPGSVLRLLVVYKALHAAHEQALAINGYSPEQLHNLLNTAVTHFRIIDQKISAESPVKPLIAQLITETRSRIEKLVEPSGLRFKPQQTQDMADQSVVATGILILKVTLAFHLAGQKIQINKPVRDLFALSDYLPYPDTRVDIAVQDADQTWRWFLLDRLDFERTLNRADKLQANQRLLENYDVRLGLLFSNLGRAQAFIRTYPNESAKLPLYYLNP